MKIASSELYKLIHALSKNEQDEFLNKHIVAGETIPLYIQLFKAYCAQKKFDESKIRKVLGLNNFERVKVYLHKNLLNYISTVSVNGVEQELMNMIAAGNLLANRMLVDQSLSIYKKARKLALKKELLHYVLILDQKIHQHETGLLNPEHSNYFRFHYYKKDFRTIIKKLDLDLESDLYLLERRLYSQNNSMLMRTDDARKGLKKIFEKYVCTTDTTLMTFNAKIKFYIVSAYYYQQLNDFEKAIYFFNKCSIAFENEDPNPSENYNNHMVAYHNLMFSYSRIRKFSEVRSLLDKVYQIKYRSKMHRIVIMQSYITYESNYCKNVVDFPFRKKRLHEVEDYFLNNKSHIPKHLYLQTCINLSVNYFIDKKFKKALEMINYSIESESENYYKDMIGVIKIYRLILFMEMEKFELLPFAIRNTYRYMLKYTQYHEFEQVVIQTLKQIVKTNSYKEQLIILTNAGKQLIDLNKRSDLQQIFLMFNFIGWIHCKTKGLEYRDLMNM